MVPLWSRRSRLLWCRAHSSLSTNTLALVRSLTHHNTHTRKSQRTDSSLYFEFPLSFFFFYFGSHHCCVRGHGSRFHNVLKKMYWAELIHGFKSHFCLICFEVPTAWQIPHCIPSYKDMSKSLWSGLERRTWPPNPLNPLHTHIDTSPLRFGVQLFLVYGLFGGSADWTIELSIFNQSPLHITTGVSFSSRSHMMLK